MYEKTSDLETLSLDEARDICSAKAMSRELALLSFVEKNPRFQVNESGHQSDFFPGTDTYLNGLAQIYHQAAHSEPSDLESLARQANQPDAFHTFVEKRPEFQELLPIYEEDKKRAFVFGLAHKQYQESLTQAEQQIAKIKELEEKLDLASQGHTHYSFRTKAIASILILGALGAGAYCAIVYWLMPYIETIADEKAKQFQNQTIPQSEIDKFFDTAEERYEFFKGLKKKEKPNQEPKDKEEDF